MSFAWIIPFFCLTILACTKTSISRSTSSSQPTNSFTPATPNPNPYPSTQGAYDLIIKSGTFYVTNDLGLSISYDNGTNWYTTVVGCQLNCNGWSGASGIAITSNGNIFLGNKYGIAKSTDGGLNFINYFSGLINASINDLYTDGDNLFARAVVGISGKGYSFSTDLGLNWTNHQYPDNLGNDNIFAFASLPGIYFYLASNQTLELKKSTDSGNSWTDITPPELRNSGIYDILGVNNKIYLATSLGVYISADSGATWVVKNSANGLAYDWISSLAYDGQRIWATDYGRILSYSTDGGNTWLQKNTLSNPDFSPRRITAEANKIMLTSFNSVGPGLAISIDGGDTFTFY